MTKKARVIGHWALSGCPARNPFSSCETPAYRLCSARRGCPRGGQPGLPGPAGRRAWRQARRLRRTRTAPSRRRPGVSPSGSRVTTARTSRAEFRGTEGEFLHRFRREKRRELRRGQCDSRPHDTSEEVTPLGQCPRPIPTRRGVPGNQEVSGARGESRTHLPATRAGGGQGKVGRVPSKAPLRKVAGSGFYGDVGHGAWGFATPPRRTPQPRGRERTHPDRISVVRNEVTPSESGSASRDAVRRTDARAGTRSPKKRTPPAARQRATGRIGLRGPTRKGADVGEAPEGRNGRRSSNRRRKLDAAFWPANGASGEQSRRLEVQSKC